MFKKILLRIMFFAGTLSATLAYSSYPLYIAATAKYQQVTAEHLRYSGLFPNLALGIGGPIGDDFYLGAEAFVDIRPIEFNNETYQGNSIRLRYGYGGSILPGLYLDNVLLAYLRLGLISSDFDKLDTWKSGYQAGIGMLAQLNDCWSARLEYDYTRYNKFDDLGMPKMDTVSVSILYKFNLFGPGED